jgi:hypothetical protein
VNCDKCKIAQLEQSNQELCKALKKVDKLLDEWGFNEAGPMRTECRTALAAHGQKEKP